MSARRLLLVATAGLVLVGCHQYVDPRRFGQVREPLPDHQQATALQVRFLSAGGFLLTRRDDVIMTPPLYTTPPLEAVLGCQGPVQHNNAAVKRALSGWVEKTDAILVGHSHYDHLIDVPYIASHLAKDARIYGSATARDLMLKADPSLDPARLMVLTDYQGRNAVDYRSCTVKPAEGCVHDAGTGEWIAEGGVRIRALCSRHSSQFAGFKVSSTGCKAPSSLQTTCDWKLGDTFAYLIDFMEGGRPVFRLYYQDSPTDPEYGFPVVELLDGKRVDVALLCAGAFDQVRDNPQGIVRHLNPRYVLLGHWENFFRDVDQPLQTLFTIDIDDLFRRLDGLATPTGQPPWKGRYWMPAPGNLFVFEPES
jgi:L-ascorbate metabolism protein UlaG (beta-lactamase superfamily)